MTVVTAPLGEVTAAHQRFLAAIADLTDAHVAAPSRLPGWTRGHVLAHLTDAARARARVVENALSGEQVAMWEPGERDAIIEATAGRDADQHREAFAETAAALERVWAAVEDWHVYEGAVFTRLREVWIHLVDLDVGVEPTEWDDAFSVHVIALFSQRLPNGHAVRATDLGRTWGMGTEIAGTAQGLAAWLLGRASTVTGPELGPWPTY